MRISRYSVAKFMEPTGRSATLSFQVPGPDWSR